MEAKYLEEMKQHLAVNEADLKAFREKTKDVYATYTDRYGDDWVKIVEETR